MGSESKPHCSQKNSAHSRKSASKSWPMIWCQLGDSRMSWWIMSRILRTRGTISPKTKAFKRQEVSRMSQRMSLLSEDQVSQEDYGLADHQSARHVAAVFLPQWRCSGRRNLPKGLHKEETDSVHRGQPSEGENSLLARPGVLPLHPGNAGTPCRRGHPVCSEGPGPPVMPPDTAYWGRMGHA